MQRQQDEAEATLARDESLRPFTEPELQALIDFFDVSGDGVIGYAELAGQVFKVRRARAVEKYMADGRRVARKLREALHEQGWTVEEWFEAMDASGAASSDGTVTSRELRIGLRRLEREEGLKLLALDGDTDEVIMFVRFIDTSGEGDISAVEIEAAFLQLDDPESAQQHLNGEIAVLMARFERAIAGKRLLGFFRNADVRHRDTLTRHDLHRALGQLMRPSGEVRAMLKAKTEQIQRVRRAHGARLREARAACAVTLSMEVSGAAEVLRRLDARIRRRGLRVSVLFQQMDTSGDGTVDREELSAMLRKMCQPSAEAKVELARRVRTHRMQRERDDADRVAKQARVERMELAMASGAMQLMQRLGDFMRERGLRTRMLVEKYLDASGDDLIDASEVGWREPV